MNGARFRNRNNVLVSREFGEHLKPTSGDWVADFRIVVDRDEHWMHGVPAVWDRQPLQWFKKRGVGRTISASFTRLERLQLRNDRAIVVSRLWFMTALAGTHVIGSEAFWGHISDKANGILEAEYFDHTPISVRYAQEVIRAVGSSVAEHKRLLKHIQK